MADFTPLPADLPEDWTNEQIVAPNGADVGLSEQHGYNYQAKQVNDAQKAVNGHVGDRENPHGATAEQVGARPDTWMPTAAQVGAYPFDQVITTQAEFEALIASPDWLGAVSVCFVGDGGTLKFTRSDGQGVKIPQTVKQIQGVNGAIVDVTNFVYHGGANMAAFWYAVRPITEEYFISNLEVNCAGSGGSCNGFYNCTKLSGCMETGTSGEGFSKCTQLTNCTAAITNTAGGACYCYSSCEQLTNCKGTSTSTADGNCNGFAFCKQLTNCTGAGTVSTGTGGNGFSGCEQLTNCTGAGNGTNSGNGFFVCTQLTNCAGTGTGAKGYSFQSCKYLNGCKQGTPAPSTGFLGGTNTKVDTATVVAS